MNLFKEEHEEALKIIAEQVRRLLPGEKKDQWYGFYMILKEDDNVLFIDDVELRREE